MKTAYIWKKSGIKEERITFLPKTDNWWGPAGKTGPCGPDTEIFFWTGKGKAPNKFNGKETKTGWKSGISFYAI